MSGILQRILEAVAEVTVHALLPRDTEGFDPKFFPTIVKVVPEVEEDITVGEELTW